MTAIQVARAAAKEAEARTLRWLQDVLEKAADCENTAWGSARTGVRRWLARVNSDLARRLDPRALRFAPNRSLTLWHVADAIRRLETASARHTEERPTSCTARTTTHVRRSFRENEFTTTCVRAGYDRRESIALEAFVYNPRDDSVLSPADTRRLRVNIYDARCLAKGPQCKCSEDEAVALDWALETGAAGQGARRWLEHRMARCQGKPEKWEDIPVPKFTWKRSKRT